MIVNWTRPDINHLLCTVDQPRQTLRLASHRARPHLSEAVRVGQDVRQLGAGDLEQFECPPGRAAADVDRDAIVQRSDDALDGQVRAQLLLADHQSRGGSRARFHLHLTVNAPRQFLLECLTSRLGHVQFTAQTASDTG